MLLIVFSQVPATYTILREISWRLSLEATLGKSPRMIELPEKLLESYVQHSCNLVLAFPFCHYIFIFTIDNSI